MMPADGAWAQRIYGGLLHLYPTAFREEYASEMRAMFRDRWHEERQSRGGAGRLRWWLALLGDTVFTAVNEHVDDVARDLRAASRALWRRDALPSTIAAVLTLAIAAGFLTAVFSVAYAVLLDPLPFREPERVVRIWDSNATLNQPRFSSSVPNFLDWQARSRSFSALAAVQDFDVNLTDGGVPMRVAGLAASAELWSVLGIEPILGRTFTANEDRPGAPAVVLVAERLWRHRFGSDPVLPGRTIQVNGTAHTVVGVVPQDVGFSRDIDIWTPLAPDPERVPRGDRRLAVIGRLAPGVTLEQADDELDRIAAELEREYPSRDRGWEVTLAPVRDWLVGSDLRTRLIQLVSAVGLLLLLACTNVAGLQLARGLERGRELGVRMALGAKRQQLTRQLVIESLLLAALGVGAGLLIAWMVIQLVPVLVPASVPRAHTAGLGPIVITAAIVVTTAVVFAFGVFPALVATRRDPQALLRQAGRSVVSSGGGRAQRALAAGQFALAVMLCVAAVLLVRSYARLQVAPIGFEIDRILTASVYRPHLSEETHARELAFLQSALAEVRSLPGIEAAGFASAVPLGGNNTTMPIGPIPRPAHIPETGIQASWRIITPGYLEALGVALQRGRFFRANESERALLLNEGLSRRLWPTGDPIGREVFIGNGQTFVVAGIVGDVQQLALGEPPTPTMYFPPDYFLWPTMTLAARTTTDPATAAASVRDALRRADSSQPVFDVRPMRSLVTANTAEPRLNSAVMLAFAAVALALAAVGVAGLVACMVATRTRELAVRRALGATPTAIVTLVARQGLGIAAAGLVVGLVGAAFAAQGLGSVLYGVEPSDPVSYALVTGVLLAAAAVACWLPARRAARIDPMLVLSE